MFMHYIITYVMMTFSIICGLQLKTIIIKKNVSNANFTNQENNTYTSSEQCLSNCTKLTCSGWCSCK